MYLLLAPSLNTPELLALPAKAGISAARLPAKVASKALLTTLIWLALTSRDRLHWKETLDNLRALVMKPNQCGAGGGGGARPQPVPLIITGASEVDLRFQVLLAGLPLLVLHLETLPRSIGDRRDPQTLHIARK
jgi:hypothetical protein